MPQINSAGRTLIEEFEGCSLTAYPDPGTGGHNDALFVDDLLNEKTALTNIGLVKSRRHVNTLLPILEPGGMMLLAFTFWDYRDCYMKLLEDEKRIVQRGGSEVYRKLIRGAYLPDGRLFAPTILSETQLAQFRAELPDKLFSSWYLNQPMEEGSKIFPKSIMKFYRGEYVFDAQPFISVEVPT